MNQSRGPNQAPNAQPSAARWIVTAVAAIALIILIFALLQTQSNEESLPEESLMSNKEWSSPPKMTIDEQNEYTTVIGDSLAKRRNTMLPKSVSITAVYSFCSAVVILGGLDHSLLDIKDSSGKLSSFD
jgi:hypothetical protein